MKLGKPTMLFSVLLSGAGAIALGLSVLVAAPISAQSGGPSLLSRLAKGEWTVRFRGGGTERKICVKTGQELIRLQHSGAQCKPLSTDDGSTEVTVNYNCPGKGYGRTSIRRETSSLVQIESQGFANGRPFQLRAEARRTGSCR
ncbi:MAG: hypothetical protein ABJP34_01990 [Erythrobacter sp.]